MTSRPTSAPTARAPRAVLGALALAATMVSCAPSDTGDGGGTGQAPPSATSSAQPPTASPPPAASPPAATPAPPSAAPAGEPLVHLAVGDSLTTGFASCPAVADCEAASWAVGTDPAVDSIRDRLDAAGFAVTSVAAAVEGARMADGVTLVDAAFAEPGAPAAADVDVVTILLGANDVCGNAPGAMTTGGDYGAALGQLLDHVATLSPGASVVLASIPRVTSVWDVASADPAATQVWALGLCRTVLSGDADARAQADERLTELQEVAATTCAEHPGCRTDDGAVADVPVTAAWLSTFDHFHPSVLGQAALAQAVWPAVEATLPSGTDR